GDALASMLRDRLAAKDLPTTERDELARQLARFARTPAVQQFLAERLNDPAAEREARRIVLRALAQANLKEAPDAWLAGLVQVLAGDDGELVREAVATARALRVPKQRADKLLAALHRIAGDNEAPASLRLNALAAIPGGPGKVEAPLFILLRDHLGPDQPVAV